MKQLYLEKSIGVDLQKEGVAIALLGKTLRGMYLLDYQIWQNSSKNQEETDRQFVENLSSFVKKNRLSNARAAICFPRHEIILKYIDIPAPTREDVKSILEFEIEKHIPLNKESIYYDFHIVEQKENKLYNILIAVSRKAEVDRCIGLLNEASIIPSLMSLSTGSSVNLLSFNDFNHNNIFIAIIELEFSHANISFVLDGSIRYTRSIPLPPDQNWEKGFFANDISNEELEKIADDAAKFLQNEINISMANCRKVSSTLAIDHFYLSGGGSLAMPIKKNLKNEFDGIVEILDPLAKFQADNISDNDRNNLANAIGSGIQNHTKSSFTIDFLPESIKKYAKDNSFKAMLILSGALAITSLVLLFSSMLNDRSTLNRIENELMEIKEEVIAVDDLERRYEKINKEKIVLKEIQIDNPGKLKILKELTSLLPSDLWLSNVVIKQGAVEIIGSADSTAKLIPILEGSDFFNDAHFIDSIKHIKNREQFKIKLPLEKNKSAENDKKR